MNQFLETTSLFPSYIYGKNKTKQETVTFIAINMLFCLTPLFWTLLDLKNFSFLFILFLLFFVVFVTIKVLNITKIRPFKYIENFTTKNWKFSDKKFDIFYISAQNIDCWYSLEPPLRGGSNEYTQSMFLSRKIMNTPVNPILQYKSGV